MRAQRRRGFTVAEVVFSTALAGLLIGVQAGELVRQQVALGTIAGETKARNALLTACERLRAGLLQVPAEGAPVTLSSQGRVTVTLERSAAGPALPPSVIAVRLCATWHSADGDDHQRELTTLVTRGAP